MSTRPAKPSIEGRHQPSTPRRFWPLRVKLIVAGLCVQVGVTGVIVLTEIRTTEDSVSKQLASSIQRSQPLLNAALIDPLLQRDYATLTHVLNETQGQDNYKYLMLIGGDGKVLASSAKHPNLPLPQLDTNYTQLPWDRADGCLHLALPIIYQGVTLATLRYGVSLGLVRDLRSTLVTSSVVIALLGLLLGTAGFAVIGMGLTRGLLQLTRSSEKVKRGEYDLFVDSEGSDELAQLASAFNGMASAVNERVKALEASESQQLVYLKRAQDEKSRLKALLHAMTLGVLLVDQSRTLLYANQAFATLWALDMADIEHAFEVETPWHRSILMRSPHAQLKALLNDEFKPDHKEHKLFIHLESGIDIQVSKVPVVNDATAVIGFLWLFEDVTVEKQTQLLIHELAERDSLTGLLNRHTFNTTIEARMGESSMPMALFFIDLDGFKMINDLNGHALGDRLLKSVANALTLTFRPEDLVARLGGDEFAVATQGLRAEQLQGVCERLLRNVSNASGTVTAFSSSPVKISCSVGVAWYPDDGADAEALLAAADQAMYAAKNAGRNTWRQYLPQQNSDARKSQWLVWSQRLNEAFEHNRFQVFLQAIFNADGDHIDHYEALVRLENSAAPGEFHLSSELILHAEDSGKVQALDRMMLTHCIQHLREHPAHPPIAVNISSRTVVDPSLAPFIQGLLTTNQVPAARLHLELTETAALTNIEQAVLTVENLQRMGCQVGLDDFGSGFTSFTYLRDLRVNYIKMDGGFVRALAADRQCQILLKAVVDIAHASGRKVIAEWIEDQATLELVRSYGVDQVQGFWLHQPEAAR